MDRETGGRDGGGSTLTPEAREIVEHYEAFMRETRQAVDRLFALHFPEEWVKGLKDRAEERK